MKKNKCSIILLLILSICLIILTYWVKIGYIKNFDDFVYSLFYHNKLITALMIGITNLGGIVGLIFITVFLFLLIPNKKIPTLLLWDLLFVSILNKLFKNIICRPRPLGLALIDVGGYSFPSGHSSAVVAFYGLLIYFVYKTIKDKNLKYSLIVVLCLLVLSIGISRIYLGVHFASDVLGGFIFGTIFIIIFIKLIDRDKNLFSKNDSKSLK